MKCTKAPVGGLQGEEAEAIIRGTTLVIRFTTTDREHIFTAPKQLAGWEFDEQVTLPSAWLSRRDQKGNMKCIEAPLGYERFQGHQVTVAVGITSLARVISCEALGEKIHQESLAGWVFDEPFSVEPGTLPSTPMRRAREIYDHEAFVKDLDEAISGIRMVVLNQWEHTYTPQPEIEPGSTLETAMFRVCIALVLRSITTPQMRELLEPVLARTRQMLIDKNKAYGNSALDPVRLFSKASLKEQLLVRLDDKVSRLARGQAAGEDVVADMLGYLVLVRIAEKRERQA